MRFTRTYTFGPVPEDVRAVYARRGMTFPDASTPFGEAATWPYHPRLAHRLFAQTHGYFWMPCVLCTRPFGGHEIVDIIPDPINGEGRGIMVCPVCTAERNGGTP